MVDQEKVKKAIELLIEGIGEDPAREGLVDTPERVARMYTELCAGYDDDAKVHLSRTFTAEGSEAVIETGITFYSLCEHHLMPFFGEVSIAYIPNGKVAGLSKLARTVEVYARRLQIQERMTGEIADAIMDELGAKGVLVVVRAEHMCMSMRGVKKPGTQTLTTASRGILSEDSRLRNEILKMMN